MNNIIRKPLTYSSQYKFEPIIELLTNDCLYRIDMTFIPNPLGNASSQNRVINYANSQNGIANKCTVLIRGINDYIGNKVDKVYYSRDNKLTVDDFSIVTDYGIEVSNHTPFGLKADNSHIYFCCALPDSRIHYEIHTMTFDNAEVSNGVVNNFKYIDWDDKKTNWYSMDKYAVYQQLVPEKETTRYVQITSSHAKFKISNLERGYIQLRGGNSPSLGGIIDREYKLFDLDNIFLTKNDAVACTLYKDDNDNNSLYIESNAIWGIIKLTASGNMRVDVVNDMDFTSLTQITPQNYVTGNTRPNGKYIPIGYYFFDTSLTPKRPIWFIGTENNVDVWVDATGTTV